MNTLKITLLQTPLLLCLLVFSGYPMRSYAATEPGASPTPSASHPSGSATTSNITSASDNASLLNASLIDILKALKDGAPPPYVYPISNANFRKNMSAFHRSLSDLLYTLTSQKIGTLIQSTSRLPATTTPPKLSDVLNNALLQKDNTKIDANLFNSASLLAPNVYSNEDTDGNDDSNRVHAYSPKTAVDIVTLLNQYAPLPPDVSYRALLHPTQKGLTPEQGRKRTECIKSALGRTFQGLRVAGILAKSVPMNNFYTMLLRRKTIKQLNEDFDTLLNPSSNEQTHTIIPEDVLRNAQSVLSKLPPFKTNQSPMQIEKTLATWRLSDPMWQNNVKTARVVDLERELVLLLAELRQQSYRQQQQMERMLATLSVIALNTLNTDQIHKARDKIIAQIEAAKKRNVCLDVDAATRTDMPNPSNVTLPQ